MKKISLILSFVLLLGVFTLLPSNIVKAAPVEYTVSFDPDDGTPFPSWFHTNVEEGELVTNIPPDPSKADYVFIGWAHSFDTDLNPILWDFAVDRVTENTTLWAAYEPIHKVVFDPEDGSPYPSWFSTEVVNGELITDIAPAPARAGYIFDGWYHSLDVDLNPILWDFAVDRVYDNTTLWPAYSELKTVTFDPQNNTSASTWFTADVRKGSPITETVPVPVNAGYNFVGWSRVADQMLPWDFASNVVNDDVTLYAIWERAEAPIKPAGGSTSENKPASKAKAAVLPKTGQAGIIALAASLLTAGAATVVLLNKKGKKN